VSGQNLAILPVNMRRRPIILIVAVIAIMSALFFVAQPLRTRKQMTFVSYFADARGLKPGARVEIAGVQVGHVETVRLRTERPESPAEVGIVIEDPQTMRIPSDAVVTLPSDGVLGPTYANIDLRNTSGPPIQNGGVLKSQAIDAVTTKQLLDKLNEIANRNNQQKGAATGAQQEQRK
jgi:phospholipid/cholesterol/gamma-HCH transport system substrate-binding protein